MKRRAKDFLQNPVLVATMVAILVLLVTASERMSTGLWVFLGVAVFLGSMKAHDFARSSRRR